MRWERLHESGMWYGHIKGGRATFRTEEKELGHIENESIVVVTTTANTVCQLAQCFICIILLHLQNNPETGTMIIHIFQMRMLRLKTLGNLPQLTDLICAED